MNHAGGKSLRHPGVSVLVLDKSVLSATPMNIHGRFTSKIRGTMVYRVFRGARWAKEMIAPVPAPL